ncbi:unnamed protein product [Lathyrus sativus]|nr:unnamed protein product [Lathyrus sativus]
MLILELKVSLIARVATALQPLLILEFMLSIKVFLDKASAAETLGGFVELSCTTAFRRSHHKTFSDLMNALHAEPGDAQVIMNNLLAVIRILEALNLNYGG